MNSKPLREREEEPRTSGENSQNRYWLRSQSGKSCEQMIQDLICQDLNSDSESEEEDTCGALPNANTGHHLHPKIRAQGQEMSEKQDLATIIINNDLEITAGQRENPDVIAARDTGNLSGDVSRGAVSDAREPRLPVSGVLSEISDVDNLECTELRNLHDNEKENEFSETKRSPYALRSHKK